MPHARFGEMCRAAVVSGGAGRWHESCSSLARVSRPPTGRPGSQVGRCSRFEAGLEVKGEEGRWLISGLECRNEEASWGSCWTS
jgi:hypothetical protein